MTPRPEQTAEKACPEAAAAEPASPTEETALPVAARVSPAPAPAVSARAAVRTALATGGQNPALGARQRYLASLRGAIEARKAYPLFARRRKLEGTVVVRFAVFSTGRLVDARVARSSGESVLDDAALEAVRSVKGLPAPPAELMGNGATVEVPLVFRLSE